MRRLLLVLTAKYVKPVNDGRIINAKIPQRGTESVILNDVSKELVGLVLREFARMGIVFEFVAVIPNPLRDVVFGAVGIVYKVL